MMIVNIRSPAIYLCIILNLENIVYNRICMVKFENIQIYLHTCCGVFYNDVILFTPAAPFLV